MLFVERTEKAVADCWHIATGRGCSLRRDQAVISALGSAASLHGWKTWARERIGFKAVAKARGT